MKPWMWKLEIARRLVSEIVVLHCQVFVMALPELYDAHQDIGEIHLIVDSFSNWKFDCLWRLYEDMLVLVYNGRGKRDVNNVFIVEGAGGMQHQDAEQELKSCSLINWIFSTYRAASYMSFPIVMFYALHKSEPLVQYFFPSYSIDYKEPPLMTDEKYMKKLKKLKKVQTLESTKGTDWSEELRKLEEKS